MQLLLSLDESETKALFKQALEEMIEERNEALYELVAEILEDMALGQAIEEGMNTEDVERSVIYQILESVD